MLPDMDGIQTCETIRSKPELRDTLIAFLTARSEDYSEIAGFQAGADDYITKPIRPKVLISRIQSLLKRTRQQVDTNIISYNEIVLNKEKMLVEMDGVSLTLPNKEFRLLKLLISKPERVFTRKEIYSLIWGSDIIVGDRTIDVHIRKLREKLQERYIYTIKGVGYVFTR